MSHVTSEVQVEPQRVPTPSLEPPRQDSPTDLNQLDRHGHIYMAFDVFLCVMVYLISTTESHGRN